MERISIFVDGGNLFFCQREKLKWWIDWKRFLDYYRSKYVVVSAYYYRAFSVPPSEEEKGFGIFLATNGFKLREKMLKKILDKNTGEQTFKGNLDVELAIDALTTIDRYDVCLLVSGDGDFQPLCRVLTQKGKIVRAVSTPGFVASEIRAELGEDFDDLVDLRPFIEKQQQSAESAKRPARMTIPSSTAPASTVNTIGGPNAPATKANVAGPQMVSPGQEFDGKVAHVSPQWARLSNPWNADVYIHASALGVRGNEDLKTILKDGDTLHVVVTEVDSSNDPWKARVDLRDTKMSVTLQTRIDASRPSPNQIPDSGEYELTISYVKEYGAFLKNPWSAKILLLPGRLKLGHINDCTKLMRVGDVVRVRVIGKEELDGPEVRLNVELAGEDYRKLLQGRIQSVTT